jgi:hypothetical protein
LTTNVFLTPYRLHIYRQSAEFLKSLREPDFRTAKVHHATLKVKGAARLSPLPGIWKYTPVEVVFRNRFSHFDI